MNAFENFAYPTSYDQTIGNPLKPRLPEVVKVRIHFMFESPYVGAPDHTRIIEQVIDVPSAYTRADLVDLASG